jgi:hypothetical protein
MFPGGQGCKSVSKQPNELCRAPQEEAMRGGDEARAPRNRIACGESRRSVANWINERPPDRQRAQGPKPPTLTDPPPPTSDAAPTIWWISKAAAAMRSIQNKCPNQINNFTSDQDQYCPYQIVDLPLETGHGLRSHLRLSREDVSQEENDRYHGQDYRYQLVHDAMSLERIQQTGNGIRSGIFALWHLRTETRIPPAPEFINGAGLRPDPLAETGIS